VIQVKRLLYTEQQGFFCFIDVPFFVLKIGIKRLQYFYP